LRLGLELRLGLRLGLERLGLELRLGLRLGFELAEILLNSFRSNVHWGNCTRSELIRVRTLPPFWFPARAVDPMSEGPISSEDGVARNFKAPGAIKISPEQDRTDWKKERSRERPPEFH